LRRLVGLLLCLLFFDLFFPLGRLTLGLPREFTSKTAHNNGPPYLYCTPVTLTPDMLSFKGGMVLRDLH